VDRNCKPTNEFSSYGAIFVFHNWLVHQNTAVIIEVPTRNLSAVQKLTPGIKPC